MALILSCLGYSPGKLAGTELEDHEGNRGEHQAFSLLLLGDEKEKELVSLQLDRFHSDSHPLLLEVPVTTVTSQPDRGPSLAGGI